MELAAGTSGKAPSVLTGITGFKATCAPVQMDVSGKVLHIPLTH